MISVIIPIYNAQAYIEKCLDSLIAQTFQDFEAILVDDGSSDESAKICARFVQRDKRFILVQKANGGAADARNSGLELMRGEYVAFIDADDYVNPLYLELLLRDLIEQRVDISVCSWLEFYENEVFDPPLQLCEAAILSGVQALERLLYQDGMDSHMWCKLFRAELFKEIRFPNGNIYEDLAVIYHIYAKANRVSYRSFEAYYHLLADEGVTLSPFSENKMLLIDTADEMYGYICDKFPNLKCAAASRLVRANFHIYFQIPKRMDVLPYRARIQQNIRRHRMTVLRDSKAEKRTKAALFVSFLGLGPLYFLKCLKWVGKQRRLVSPVNYDY